MSDKNKNNDKNQNQNNQNNQNQNNQSYPSQTLTNFNNMINYAYGVYSNNANSPQQNKNNNLNSLKQDYLDAQANLANAPSEVEQTFKAYYVYKEGEPAYNEYMLNQLENKAKVIADKFKTEFSNKYKITESDINGYAGILINLTNLYDLSQKYKSENKELEKKLKSMSSDTITNDRKTYYEDQGVNIVLSWYTVILIIYAIGVIIFSICLFIFPSNAHTIFNKLGIILLLVLYPFIGLFIFGHIYKFVKSSLAYLPKNVYTNL